MKKARRKAIVQSRAIPRKVNKGELYTFSPGVINLLRKLNYRQADIGKLIGKTPSFVSHVRCNRRSLTLNDLEKIEKKTGLPVFWLLLQASNEDTIPEELKHIYRHAKDFFTYSTMASIVAKNVFRNS